ncbi:MAG: WxL protein peptidoglycan domain-containing protein, partial [Actinomycetota bacterium]
TDPGVKVVQSLALRNDSSKPLALRLAGVDATTGPFGGASYGLENEPAARVGAWISLERTSVTLAPGESEIVDFEVEVPPDADSGEHLAGISVFSPAPDAETEGAGEGEAGAAIHIQTRRIVAMQVNLPGPSQPELVISGVDAAARPDGLYLEIGMENAGRGLTKGQGFVEIPGEGFQQSFDVDTFVPGTSIAYPVRWTDSVPEGEYSARVEVEYEDGVASWEGTFTVGRGVLEELAERGVEVPESSRPSWVWVAVAAGAVALAGLFLFWLRRRTPERVSGRPRGVGTPSAAPETARSVRPMPPPPPPPPPAHVPPPPAPRLREKSDSRDEAKRYPPAKGSFIERPTHNPLVARRRLEATGLLGLLPTRSQARPVMWASRKEKGGGGRGRSHSQARVRQPVRVRPG